MSLVGEDVCEPLRRNRLARIPGYDHTFIFHDLMLAAREALRRIPVDVVYMRYMPTFSAAVTTLRQLKSGGGKLILEYPTYPKEQENSRFFLRRQVFRYTDRVLGWIHPMVDLYTLIGAPCDGTLDGQPAMDVRRFAQREELTAHANAVAIRMWLSLRGSDSGMPGEWLGAGGGKSGGAGYNKGMHF